MNNLLTAVVRAAVQDLEPAALEVQALRGEVAEGEETLTDCLTSLGQEEAKVCEAVRWLLAASVLPLHCCRG